MKPRQLKINEVNQIRRAVASGELVGEVARRFGRHRGTVRFHCEDILQERAEKRLLSMVSAWDCTPISDREELADEWGYKSAKSMAVVVSRLRKRNKLPPATNRHPALTDEDRERIRALADEGLSAAEIADLEGCKIGTVHRTAVGRLQRKASKEGRARAQRIIAACKDTDRAQRPEIARRFGLKNAKTLSTTLYVARKRLASEARA